MRALSTIGRTAFTLALAAALPAVVAAQAGAPVTRLSLDEAVRMAVARNQALQAQRLSIDAARADEITAGLKPNLGVSVGAEGFPTFSPRQVTWDFVKNVASYTASASYLFERGGKRDNRVAVAQAATDVTAKTVLDAERQLRFDTAQAFVSLLYAKSTLDLARQNLESFSQVVEVNRQRVTSGDLAEAEFYRISLQKLQFEQDVSAGEVGLEQARASLRRLLGFDQVAEDVEPAGELAAAPATLDLEDLKRQALDARPDLQAARSNVTLAQNTLALETSNKARDIAGDLSYSHTGPSNSMGVGASFDLPIHDRNQGNIARSEVLLRQATESELATRYLVTTDVVNAYAAWTSARKVVALYESGYLKQSQQSLDISRYVYQRGAGSLLDLLDAERTYRDTQIGYRQALSNYMTSVQQLNFAVGRQVFP
jgi:cobalt-zinc-cadmium efflux system outer membrane protein